MKLDDVIVTPPLRENLHGNILLLGGGLALSIFVGWIMSGAIEAASQGTERARWLSLWQALLRYAVPAFLFFVLVYDAIPSTWTTITSLF